MNLEKSFEELIGNDKIVYSTKNYSHIVGWGGGCSEPSTYRGKHPAPVTFTYAMTCHF